jgi:hypothetical protein
MKYIITETQHHYLRRLSIFDKLIDSSLKMFDGWHKSNIDVDYVIKFLTEDITEMYFFKTHEDIHVPGEEYDKLSEFIKKYLETNWRDKIETLIKHHKGK